jgi:hypothetical protein
MIRHFAIEAKPAEPAVSEVQVDLLAQPTFGPNAVAVADQQHPHEQFRIDRRSAGRAVEWRQFATNTRKVDEPVDCSQQMGRRHVPLERELVEQSRLISLLRTHHRFSLRQYR